MAEPDSELERLRVTNRSLTEELLAAYEELDLLHTLSSIFATSTDIDEMGERLVAEAVDALQAGAGFLAFTGDGMEEFDPVLRGVSAEEVQAFVRIAAPKILAGEVSQLDNAEAEGFESRPLVTVPLRSRDGVFGALGLLRAPGGRAFTTGDAKALAVLASQAAAVILQKRNLDLTFLSETLKQYNEALQTLLEISRELTGTLDVDRVLSAIVNLPGQVVAFDRAAIALREGGRWRLRAVSGTSKVERSADNADLENLLGWVGERGEPISVETGAEGKIAAERPEIEEMFRGHFERSGMSSFFSLLLADEEGLLGVLALERKTGLCPSDRARELLTVLANQATVALRNAQLYQQVPLIGLLEPVLRRGRWFRELPALGRITWVGIGAAALAAFLFVPAPLRVGGNAYVAPERTVLVSAAVSGRVREVAVREGETVRAGQVLARLDDREYRLQRSEALARAEAADRHVRQLEAAADPRAAQVERARAERFRAEVALSEAALAETALLAPEEGVVLTPRVRERLGERLETGEVFCALASLAEVDVEIAVPETDLALVEIGQEARIKLHAYPHQEFQGRVVGKRPAAEERDGSTVLVARVRLRNAAGELRPGMSGRGRIYAGRVNLATFLFRRPVRWIRTWFWL